MFTFNEILTEVTSTIRRNAFSKRAAFAGAGAMSLARHKNPALFNQYTKYNTMRKLIKERINRQYGPMAKSMARRRRF